MNQARDQSPEKLLEMFPELFAHQAVDETVARTIEHQKKVANVTCHQRP